MVVSGLMNPRRLHVLSPNINSVNTSNPTHSLDGTFGTHPSSEFPARFLQFRWRRREREHVARKRTCNNNEHTLSKMHCRTRQG